MAGNLSVIECGNVFQNREASSNYGIDGQGRVGLYVDESKASWANGNLKSNQRSVTIELANDEIGGKWHVSDTALEKCIQLCADICVRNGIKKLNYTGDTTGNLTAHRFFMSTSCPGPYLFGRFQYIADEVNKRIKGGWVRDGADWHFYKDGLILKNAWAEDKVGWTWLGSDGNIVKNSWLKEKGVWYYLGADGYMAKNKWQKDKTGQWCYLGADGKQALDKWLIYKSNIYYIKPDGYMATGRMSLECEFDDSGKLKR
jgi:hypothetical protein